MYRVSVTELEQYVDCEVRHDRRYRQGVRLRQEEDVMALGVGSAVARAAELYLMLGEEAAYAYIENEVQKERDKVLICFNAFKEVLIEGSVVSEDKLEVGYIYGGDSAGMSWKVWDDPSVMMVGKPDIWYVEYDETYTDMDPDNDYPPIPIGVHVIDLKTTSQYRTKLDDMVANYNVFNLQTARYCVLLHDLYPWLREIPFYQHHILINYKGDVAGDDSGGMPVSEGMMDWARQEMLGLAHEAATKETSARRFAFSAFRCGRCDQQPLCDALLTGKNYDDILEQLFTVKEVRG